MARVLLLAALLALALLLGGCILFPNGLPEPGKATPGSQAEPVPIPAPEPTPAPEPEPALEANNSTASAPLAAGELMALMDRMPAANYTAKYDVSYAGASPLPLAATLALYRQAPNLSRTDFSDARSIKRAYVLGPDSISCSRVGANWSCARGPSIVAPAALLTQTPAALKTMPAETRPSQMLAGLNASCYRLEGSANLDFDGQVLLGKAIEICLSEQGVPLYYHLVALKAGQDFEATLTASSHAAANASDFILPAPLPPPPDPRFSMVFYQVGQSDATLVVSGNFTMLIDTGSAEAADRLSSALASADVTHIDVLVVSTWNAEKLGGLDTLSKRFSFGEIWVSGPPPPGPVFRYSWLALQQTEVPIRNVSAGDRFRYGSLLVEVLNPPNPPYSTSTDANSVVLRLWYHGFCAFLPGDIQEEQEPPLVGTVGTTACDLYKWPYHGRGRPQASLLVDRLKPSAVLISVGQNNDGLPSPTTLERLKISKTPVWRTDGGDVQVDVSAKGAYAIRRGSGD